jgi:hypothetical protein
MEVACKRRIWKTKRDRVKRTIQEEAENCKPKKEPSASKSWLNEAKTKISV